MTIITDSQWTKIGVRHHHGVALPVSALHSQHSAGCGDFATLQEFLPILASWKFDVLQLLPLNDSGGDSSPYMGLSGYALHPIYLALPSLPNFFQKECRKKTWQLLKKEEKKHPARFDYQHVVETKRKLLSDYLDDHQSTIEEEPDFLTFCTREHDWLESNAAFTALKQMHHQIAWWDWPIQYRTFPCTLPEQAKKDAQRWKVVQFLCYTQLKSVKERADSLSISLMGDLPILLNKDSSDVWAHPELFNTNLEVGAPPDMYSKEGQKWGFPLYNWKGHFKENLSWWKGRLRYAEQFYHMYRLDHIVGFYRLYAMAPNTPPSQGHFIPQQEKECLEQGEHILQELVSSSTMFPIGEDLGDIPDYVRQSLHRLGIPGTKVMRWERLWHEPGQPFIPVGQYNPESVTTVSTHDSSTLEGWSLEDKKGFQEALKNWNISSSHPIEAILRLSHNTASLFSINLLQEYIRLFENMSWDEERLNRINVPGTVSPLNWTFRFRPSIEELKLNEKKSIVTVQESG